MLARSMWDEMNDFRRSFDQLFGNLTTFSRPQRDGVFTFLPHVETGWTDESLNLRFVVQGVSEKELRITVQGNQLQLQGERKAPEGFAKGGNANLQLAYGKFERVLDLPNGLDVEKMSAHLHDGVLDIRIPLAEAMKPRQIQVQIQSGQQRQLQSASA
ncbi:MAG TPA: Hsp20/alpha crystallin family protein [Bryobacteraceae bacterium]|nr:Hsp20/alpha crystallin family protein [Bryobacteraceae bacterium]